MIADLSVNYVERFVLLCGHTIEKFSSDYGYDLILCTYGDDGELENGNIYVQLKATDNIRLTGSSQSVSFSLKKPEKEKSDISAEPAGEKSMIRRYATEKILFFRRESYF